MGILYKTEPMNYEELVNSIRGQVERQRERVFSGGEIPREELVSLTAESLLSLLDRMEVMAEILSRQAKMHIQIEKIFRFIFEQHGVDFDEAADDIVSETEDESKTG